MESDAAASQRRLLEAENASLEARIAMLEAKRAGRNSASPAAAWLRRNLTLLLPVPLVSVSLGSLLHAADAGDLMASQAAQLI
jgi:hypothetical protein